MLYVISRTREAARVRFREEHMDGVDRKRYSPSGDKMKGLKVKTSCLVLLPG